MKGYSGVKFRVEFVGKEAPQGPRISELKNWCKAFHEKNLAPPYPGGSYGNLSFRLEQGKSEFLITGSRIGLKDKLQDSCFVKVISCDFGKKVVFAKGEREPSSESMLHFAIYEKRQDVNAIFHGHCQEILDKAGELGIVETEKEEEYGTMELVQRVLDVLGENNFLMMKSHGFISLGKTMQDAGELSLKMLEKSLG